MGRIRRVLNIRSGDIERQLTDSDCAVWVVKAICFQLGVSVPPANLIRKHIEIESGGSSVRSVRDALGRFGISARPVTGPIDAIAHAPLPAIALIQLESSALHYIVVLEASNGLVKYLDPGVGGAALTVDAEQFQSMFTGSLVLCDRQPGYVTINFEEDVDPNRFLMEAVSSEMNPAIALAIGEVFQLLALLVGILMLKSFFGSSIFGLPNFWFLAGMAICGFIYMWIGKLHRSVLAEIKSRTLLSLLDLATALIRDFDFDPKKGMRDTSTRCLNVVCSVANSIANVVSVPGNTVSLILFISLVAWIDVWAAGYAIALAIVLPVIGYWQSRRTRLSRREVARHKERNEIGFIYLMAKSEPENDINTDLPWNQLSFCDALAKRDGSVASENMVAEAVARLNIFAGLLIGGLQHAECGMGHTVAVFFLLSIYSTVVGQWSRRLASISENRFQVRALLDFLSDFTNEPLKYSTIVNENADQRIDVTPAPIEKVKESDLGIGGVV